MRICLNGYAVRRTRNAKNGRRPIRETNGVKSKPLTEKIVDLNDLLADALAKSEHLIVEVDDDLPKVRGDYDQLIFLLQNLIQNGLKFNKSGSPKVKIQVQKSCEVWQISVCDNGIGIAPKYLECVFDLFRQLHLATEYAGEGAGLSICRQTAEHHLGELWIESEEGVGTKAIFTLPAL